MKKTFIIAMAVTLGLMASCKKEDLGPRPTDIEASSITSEPTPGGVMLKWAVPSDSNYRYIRVNYKTPEMEKEATRMASVYADGMLVDNLLARYGEIEFKLTPVSTTGVEGTTQTIKAQAQAKPKTTKITDDAAVEVKLANPSGDIFVSDPHIGEGSKEALVDHNEVSYYHENWSSPKPLPHYIVYKLPKALKAFHFYMKSRNHVNRTNPKAMDILVSDSFNGSFDPEANKAVKLRTLTGLPDAQAAAYTSPAMLADKDYQYVWFKINEIHNRGFSAIAELHVFSHKTSVYDPETGETTVE